MTNATKPKLMDQARARLRTLHYAYATEKHYLGWIRRFIIHFNKRHPLELGPEAVGQYLTHLAVQRHVAPATQNQALNALVFLYREVLGVSLDAIPGIEWAEKRARIPGCLLEKLLKQNRFFVLILHFSICDLIL